MMCHIYWNWRLATFLKIDLSVFIRYSTSSLVTCPVVAGLVGIPNIVLVSIDRSAAI